MFAEDAISLIIIASLAMAAFVWTKYKTYIAAESNRGNTEA